MAAEPAGDGAGRAGAEEGIEHDVARIAGGQQNAREQRFGLLGRMKLAAGLVLQPFLARAERDEPVRAHLKVVIATLQRLVMEGVALGLGAAHRPDQSLVRVGETPALEVRHRVDLAPDDVVQHPEAEILEDRPDAEDVVVGADHPQGAVRLEHAAAFDQPGTGEGIVVGEGREFVPIVVDGVDHARVGAGQFPLELKVVGRVGENEINAAGRQTAKGSEAITNQHAVDRKIGSGDGR